MELSGQGKILYFYFILSCTFANIAVFLGLIQGFYYYYLILANIVNGIKKGYPENILRTYPTLINLGTEIIAHIWLIN